MNRHPGAVLSLVALSLVALAGPAGAQSATEVPVGWWTRNPAQSAPAGGFAVASAPDGPVTVAAASVDIDADVLSVTLSAVETGGFGQGGAQILVCPAAGPAQLPAEPGGALEDAPEADCDRASVPFERDPDALRWTADVTSLVGDSAGTAALVILPATGEGALQPAFDVRFAAPTADVLTEPVGQEATPGSGTGGPSSPPPSSEQRPTVLSAPSSTGDLVLGTPAPLAGGPGRASAAPDPVSPEPADGAAEPAEGTAEVAAPRPPTPQPVVPIATAGGSVVGRGLSYVALSALAGVAVAVASRVSRLRAGT